MPNIDGPCNNIVMETKKNIAAYSLTLTLSESLFIMKTKNNSNHCVYADFMQSFANIALPSPNISANCVLLKLRFIYFYSLNCSKR